MDEVLKKAYQKIFFIALAMIYGCLMFMGMVVYLIQKPSSSAVPMPENIRYMAWAMGAFSLGISFVLKQKFLIPETSVAADPQEKMTRRISKLISSTLIAFALTESAVLMGLIVLFLSKNINDIYVPLLFGLLGFGAHFPRPQVWQSYAEKH